MFVITARRPVPYISDVTIWEDCLSDQTFPNQQIAGAYARKWASLTGRSYRVVSLDKGGDLWADNVEQYQSVRDEFNNSHSYGGNCFICGEETTRINVKALLVEGTYVVSCGTCTNQ